ncbi:MAG: SET domain-containing protein-lysine N-methyltransferase, partial [Bacteroidota bacterium]
MLIVKKSSLHNSGKGLFTTHDIKKVQIVCEYEGEMITWDEATKRNTKDVKKG